MPTFAAVQAWAGADRRARVIAAVNVLNAAFMVGRRDRRRGRCRQLGVDDAGAVRAASASPTSSSPSSSAAPCRRARCSDFLSIVFRAFYRLEVKGLENLAQGRARTPIIALNHVSFLDAALALSLLPQGPGLRHRHRAWRSTGGSSRSCKLTRAMPLDPTKPMATRTLINAVKARRDADHLPGGPHHRHRQPDEGL